MNKLVMFKSAHKAIDGRDEMGFRPVWAETDGEALAKFEEWGSWMIARPGPVVAVLNPPEWRGGFSVDTLCDIVVVQAASEEMGVEDLWFSGYRSSIRSLVDAVTGRDMMVMGVWVGSLPVEG